MNIFEKIKSFFYNLLKPKAKELPSNDNNVNDAITDSCNKFEESLKVDIKKQEVNEEKEIITPVVEGDGTGFQTIKKY